MGDPVISHLTSALRGSRLLKGAHIPDPEAPEASYVVAGLSLHEINPQLDANALRSPSEQRRLHSVFLLNYESTSNVTYASMLLFSVDHADAFNVPEATTFESKQAGLVLVVPVEHDLARTVARERTTLPELAVRQDIDIDMATLALRQAYQGRHTNGQPSSELLQPTAPMNQLIEPRNLLVLASGPSALKANWATFFRDAATNQTNTAFCQPAIVSQGTPNVRI
ncbi:MAG: hypothetical protein Q9217_004684 [Psora testacea]